MKKYSRKEFIQLSTAAGIALFISSCDNGSDTSTTKKAPAALPMKQPPAVAKQAIKLDLVDKNSDRYNILRRGFNTRIDKHPRVIAVCNNTEEVAAAVKYARENNLPVAIKSGGHSMEGFSCNDDGMVINLSKMSDVKLLDGGIIQAGPGCVLSNLYDNILPHGRIVPAGSCATVGLGGLTLGGGYGIFSRKYGLTCDHLLEATMVDGNGNIVSTKDDEELLWALRGGGTGNFGIVTEMKYRSHEAPATLQAHYFKARKLDPERAAAILEKWMAIAAKLPDTCFSGYVLNGTTLNILITNYGTPTPAFKAQLADLATVTDEFHSSHAGKLQTMLRNYYGVGNPLYFRNSSAGFFDGYHNVAPFIKDVFAQTINTPGMIYQVNTLGGKIKDPAFEHASCYPHRAHDFVSELQAYSTTPAQHERTAHITTEVLKLTEQNGISTQYVNYCSLEFSDWEHAYYGDNYSRLQAIKRKYDPDDIIRHPQSIRLG